MTNDRSGERPHVDEDKLLMVREFLRGEFRDCQFREYIEVHTSNRVFLIETDGGLRQPLVIPTQTFDAADFARLLNVQLVTALKLARGVRITLTPQGGRY
jgi:hypothetical protein